MCACCFFVCVVVLHYCAWNHFSLSWLLLRSHHHSQILDVLKVLGMLIIAKEMKTGLRSQGLAWCVFTCVLYFVLCCLLLPAYAAGMISHIPLSFFCTVKSPSPTPFKHTIASCIYFTKKSNTHCVPCLKWITVSRVIGLQTRSRIKINYGALNESSI